MFSYLKYLDNVAAIIVGVVSYLSDHDTDKLVKTIARQIQLAIEETVPTAALQASDRARILHGLKLVVDGFNPVADHAVAQPTDTDEWDIN